MLPVWCLAVGPGVLKPSPVQGFLSLAAQGQEFKHGSLWISKRETWEWLLRS